MESVIAVENLSKTYKSGHPALQNINLQIRKGEIFALLGPNGAGKTTLISIICGIVNPGAGRVRVAGFDIKADYRAARSAIGLVPQELVNDVFETVWATVRFSRGLFGKKPDPQYLEQLLKDLSLWDKRDAKIFELSGGMKRRVALARAIALDPQILLYDEPFVGQDPIAMGVLVRLIRLLNDALGITSVVVSHDLAETASIADYIYVVGDAQVLGQGTPAELMESDNPRIRQFMKGIPDGPVPFHFPAPDYREDLLGRG